MKFDDDYDIDFGNTSPYWRCESCGYEDHNKKLPKIEIDIIKTLNHISVNGVNHNH